MSLGELGKSFFIGVEAVSEASDETGEVPSAACSEPFLESAEKATLREFFQELFYLWVKDDFQRF